MDILTQLKTKFNEETGVNSGHLKLPTKISFEMSDKNLVQIYLKENNVLLNMQEDSAAFESWAFILKRWINPDLTIRIKWKEPKLHFLTAVQKQHYQRFLYRAKRVSETVSWLEVDESNRYAFNQLEIDYEQNIDFLMNIPLMKRTKKHKEEDLILPLATLGETKLESILVFDEPTAETLKRITNTNSLFNQMPVGVFKESVAKDSAVFPGKKGAIDFVGIDKDEETLTVFELKKYKNKPAGIISELLFYCLLMNDVQNKRIKVTAKKDDFTEKINKTSQVKGVFLAPGLHPLLDKKVIKLLNKSFSELSIQFDMLKIVQNSNGLNFENV